MFQNLNAAAGNAAYTCVRVVQHTSFTTGQNVSEHYMNKIPGKIRSSQPENRHQLSGKIQFCVKHVPLWPALLSHSSVMVKIISQKTPKGLDCSYLWSMKGTKHPACLYLQSDIFPVSSPFHPPPASEMPCVFSHRLLTRRSFSCCICTMSSGGGQSFSFRQNGGQKCGREGWFMKTVDCLHHPILIVLSLRWLDSEGWVFMRTVNGS